MEARFIGSDGSMGLSYGKIYNITITKDARYVWVNWESKEIGKTILQLLGGTPSRCPYRNEQTFHENWDII
mgnify:CR=1 FL=1